jgi:hypothetical protein
MFLFLTKIGVSRGEIAGHPTHFRQMTEMTKTIPETEDAGGSKGSALRRYYCSKEYHQWSSVKTALQ